MLGVTSHPRTGHDSAQDPPAPTSRLVRPLGDRFAGSASQ
jgi:hypothetical protein